MPFEELDLHACYERARRAYTESTAGDENIFTEELGMSVGAVGVIDESVRITFNGKDKISYLLESKLKLVSFTGKELGYYCLHEDETGNIVDDFLVFE